MVVVKFIGAVLLAAVGLSTGQEVSYWVQGQIVPNAAKINESAALQAAIVASLYVALMSAPLALFIIRSFSPKKNGEDSNEGVSKSHVEMAPIPSVSIDSAPVEIAQSANIENHQSSQPSNLVERRDSNSVFIGSEDGAVALGWDIKADTVMLPPVASIVEADRQEEPKSYDRAKLVIEYSDDANAAWVKVQALPAEYHEEFLKSLEENGSCNPHDLLASLIESHRKIQRPFDSDVANDALEEVRTISTSAATEFVAAYSALGTRADIANIVLKIESKFGPTEKTRVQIAAIEADRLLQAQIEQEAKRKEEKAAEADRLLQAQNTEVQERRKVETTEANRTHQISKWEEAQASAKAAPERMRYGLNRSTHLFHERLLKEEEDARQADLRAAKELAAMKSDAGQVFNREIKANLQKKLNLVANILKFLISFWGLLLILMLSFLVIALL